MKDLQQRADGHHSDEQLQMFGWIVAVICAAALPSGAAKLLPGILSDPGKLNEDGAKAMIQVFLLTGPLVLAAAFTALCVMRNWFEKQAMWVLVFVFIAAWLLGRVGFGMAPAVPQEVPSVSHPAGRVVAFVLAGYAEVTGWPLTIASVLLGCFFGFVFNNKMPREWRQLLDKSFSSGTK